VSFVFGADGLELLTEHTDEQVDDVRLLVALSRTTMFGATAMPRDIVATTVGCVASAGGCWGGSRTITQRDSRVGFIFTHAPLGHL